MLRQNEQDPMPIPTAEAIAADWPFPEGMRFMQLFFYFVKWVRKFVTEISQREQAHPAPTLTPRPILTYGLLR